MSASSTGHGYGNCLLTVLLCLFIFVVGMLFFLMLFEQVAGPNPAPFP